MPAGIVASHREREVFRPLASWLDTFDDVGRRVRAEYNRHPLERYHRIHNKRLHPLVVSLVLGFYSAPPYLFRHWYSNAKGVAPLDLAQGRFSLGFEVQRVLLFQGSRRYSGPLQSPDACYSLAGEGGSLCYSMISFREGDRRYGLTVRWNIDW